MHLSHPGTAMVANELVRAETAAILRHARVIQIKRAALGLAPIVKFPVARPTKPRAVLIIPSRYARLLQACRCLRAR
jgi:hypothetical protein